MSTMQEVNKQIEKLTAVVEDEELLAKVKIHTATSEERTTIVEATDKLTKLKEFKKRVSKVRNPYAVFTIPSDFTMEDAKKVFTAPQGIAVTTALVLLRDEKIKQKDGTTLESFTFTNGDWAEASGRLGHVNIGERTTKQIFYTVNMWYLKSMKVPKRLGQGSKGEGWLNIVTSIYR